MSRTRAGFTLIEILIVIAIILVLAAVLVPVLANVQEKSRQATCLSNQHQLSLGIIAAQQDTAYFGRHDAPDPQLWIREVRPSVAAGKTWRCPSDTADTKRDETDYGMNAYLYGIAMTAVREPTQVVMLADSRAPLLQSSGDVATRRHAKGYVASFVDGHQEWLNPGNSAQTVIYGNGESGMLLSFGADHLPITYSDGSHARGESTRAYEGVVVVLTNTAPAQITATVTATGGDTPPAGGLDPMTADLTIKPGFARAFALYCRTNSSNAQKVETIYTFGLGAESVAITVTIPPEELLAAP